MADLFFFDGCGSVESGKRERYKPLNSCYIKNDRTNIRKTVCTIIWHSVTIIKDDPF